MKWSIVETTFCGSIFQFNLGLVSFIFEFGLKLRSGASLELDFRSLSFFKSVSCSVWKQVFFCSMSLSESSESIRPKIILYRNPQRLFRENSSKLSLKVFKNFVNENQLTIWGFTRPDVSIHFFYWKLVALEKIIDHAQRPRTAEAAQFCQKYRCN